MGLKQRNKRLKAKNRGRTEDERIMAGDRAVERAKKDPKVKKFRPGF